MGLGLSLVIKDLKPLMKGKTNIGIIRTTPVSTGLLLLLLLSGCRWEGAPDCLQGAGPQVNREISLVNFDKITVFENVRLVLRSGSTQRVELSAPDNLLNDISAVVDEGRLILRNENNCNFFRDYGLVVFTVTSPNITEVRSFTGWTISSQGTLDWDRLNLISESFVVTDSETTDGSFDLSLDNDRTRIVVNGGSYFQLEGRSGFLYINVAAGNSRIESLSLSADSVEVLHRGSQDVLVNPQLEISGRISGYGDVISATRPPQVEVEETFNGRLRFLQD